VLELLGTALGFVGGFGAENPATGQKHPAEQTDRRAAEADTHGAPPETGGANLTATQFIFLLKGDFHRAMIR
jgi:hypothetical protein